MSIGIGRGHFPANAADDRGGFVSISDKETLPKYCSFGNVSTMYVIDVLKTPLNWGLFPVNATHGDGDIVGNVKEAFNVMTQCRINDCPDSGL